MATLTIKGNSHNIMGLEILLDGKKINSLLGVTVEMAVDGYNHATFRVLVDEIDIDAEALTTLEAIVKQGQAVAE